MWSYGRRLKEGKEVLVLVLVFFLLLLPDLLERMLWREGEMRVLDRLWSETVGCFILGLDSCIARLCSPLTIASIPQPYTICLTICTRTTQECDTIHATTSLLTRSTFSFFPRQLCNIPISLIKYLFFFFFLQKHVFIYISCSLRHTYSTSLIWWLYLFHLSHYITYCIYISFFLDVY